MTDVHPGVDEVFVATRRQLHRVDCVIEHDAAFLRLDRGVELAKQHGDIGPRIDLLYIVGGVEMPVQAGNRADAGLGFDQRDAHFLISRVLALYP